MSKPFNSLKIIYNKPYLFKKFLKTNHDGGEKVTFYFFFFLKTKFFCYYVVAHNELSKQ